MFLGDICYPFLSYCGEFQGDKSGISIIDNFGGFRMNDHALIRISWVFRGVTWLDNVRM